MFMRNFSYLVFVCLIVSCTAKHKKQERASGGWKELETFHMVMAEAYHPLKDSGNVAPAKKIIGRLADEAEKWAASTLPEQVNTAEMKEMLQTLKTDARALADEVGKVATDDVVKEKMERLHDQFHKIMEVWHRNRGGDDDDKEEDDDHEDHED